MEPLQMNEKTAPELPQGWVWTGLRAILGFVKGKKPKNLGAKSELLTIPYINIKAFEHGVFNQFTDGDGCPLCKSDDILIVWDGARCGLVGRGVTGAIGSTLAKLDYYGLKSPYLFYFLQTQYERINKRPRGVGIPHVEPELFWNIPFPLPPLPEQRRIVTKIEELFARLDAGVGALTEAKAQLKRYRQSVLKSACEGRLVPTEAELARAEGRDYEHADVLLARIQKERREKWEAEKKRKGRKSAKYNEPAAPDVSGLPELPEGWVWVGVEQLASPEHRSIQSGPFGSSLLHSEFQDTGILAIGIDNVLDGHFSLGKQHRISPEKFEQLRKFSARPLDVLITVMATVGRCCVVPANLESAIITKHVYRISVNKDFINPFYLMFCLLGGYDIQRQIFGQIRGQTRPGINGTILKSIAISVPPLLEQHRIVAEIERRLSVADETEKTIDQNLKQAERLRQSILKRAFEGKLVSQDPNDESASVLLERIKAGKAKCEAEKKTENKRKRKGNPKQKKSI